MRVLKASLIAVIYLAWGLAGLLPAEHVHPLPDTDSSIVHRHFGSHHDHPTPARAPGPDDDHDHVLTLDTLLACRVAAPDIQLPALSPHLLTFEVRMSWVGSVAFQSSSPTASPPAPGSPPRAPPA